ncbi:nicotinate phosphoribosyltransferase [Multifurca ochricompacta]|uniref:Nicotinate phosphoribosyltransferase n=1 Tax=Multifurca ochricompacta TaxID=376703 RepID=A0AAD4QKJ3_9AGAM|nr:nicotinate phosphoribosyltransferase [Multifurca ochricompacta]
MSGEPDPGVIIILPRSLLDTDLYKARIFTMQQAVLHHFPDTQSTYKFTHRDAGVYFTRQSYEQFVTAISQFSSLSLTPEERTWLQNTCPYFKPDYLDYLSTYRFKPSQVQVSFVPRGLDSDEGRIEIEASGPWTEAILWEVPLMATLSEIYYTTANKDWTDVAQAELAYGKGVKLLEAGCTFSEFGTRRRRSYHTQDVVVAGLVRAQEDHPGKGKLVGTSNVHFARIHGINPVGTIAHEWFMGVAAVRGYEHANGIALDLWEEVYPNSLLIALTDTFSTKAFFQDFAVNVERARRWLGLRQDSGDPFAFAPQAREAYERLAIDYREKTIIYSDSLDLDKVIALKKQCEDIGFIPAFGIGTFFTNDFRSWSSKGKEKSKALNIVIKLASIDGLSCVKISDDLMKNTGDRETVLKVKAIFGLPK